MISFSLSLIRNILINFLLIAITGLCVGWLANLQIGGKARLDSDLLSGFVGSIIGGEIDGIETAAIISKRANCSIIFLTGNDDEDSLIRATRVVKPLAYLIKPFNREDFCRTFAVTVSNRDKIEPSYLLSSY